jgi:hypothetical protein
MEKIKDIVLVGFAIVGFVSVLSSFSEQQVYGTPESHEWELSMSQSRSVYFTHNKVTGEVRSFDIINTSDERKALKEGKGDELVYRVGTEVK